MSLNKIILSDAFTKCASWPTDRCSSFYCHVGGDSEKLVVAGWSMTKALANSSAHLFSDGEDDESLLQQVKGPCLFFFAFAWL